MQKWEYMVFDERAHDSRLTMDYLGLEGWEAYAVRRQGWLLEEVRDGKPYSERGDYDVYFLKRPIVERPV